MKEKTEITAWNEGRGTSGGREMGCEWLGTNTLSETHLPHVQMHHVPKQKQTKGGNCDHRLIISAGQETANINFMNLVFQKYNDDVHSRHHCRMATKTKTDFDSGGINVDMYEWLNTQTERRTGCMHSSLDGWMEARRPARMNEGVILPWSETSTIPHNNYGLTPTAGSVLIRPAFRANTHHKDINMPWLKATSLRP